MKRLVVALLISLVGVALSWQFLRPREWVSKQLDTRNSIAKVLSIQNDVSRQISGRLLWSPVRVGDEIFLGDKIKTAGLSGIVVELLESKSKLEIEENSIVLMSQGDKKLSLNMLEGRLFVNSADGSASGVDLVSGNKKIDLSGNAAISVGRDGASVVDSFSAGENIFTDLKPQYSETVLSDQSTTQLSWKPNTKMSGVTVRVGESPLTMAEIPAREIDVTTGRLNVPLKAGTNYWQLSTTIDGQAVSSPLMKLNLVRPQPPLPLFPAELETVRLENRPFDFKWLRGNTGDSVRLEVARDTEFRNIVLTNDSKDQTFFTPKEQLTPGSYFWRLKSQLSQNDWAISKTVAFTVHQGNEQISPTPLAPFEKAVLYVDANGSRRVTLTWRKQDSARGYEVNLRGPGETKTLNAEKESIEATLASVGEYSWEVVAVDGAGKKSILPNRRTFEIRRRGEIKWLMSEQKFLYLKDLPIVIFRWQKAVAGPSEFSISQSPDMKLAERFQVRENDFPYRIPKDGIFYTQVNALSDDSEIKAQSAVLEFVVQPAPVPPAPTLSKPVEKLLANAQGDLKLSLGNMKPNWIAIAQVQDVAGKTLDERRFTDANLIFLGLLPGQYRLNVKFTDEYQRASDSGIFQLEVPEKSRVPAPKLKGIKVR